jgi:LPXTG-site transpeptidase (sortase) family protein
MTNTRLHRINTLLLIAIILINGYVIAAPFLPQVSYWWQARHTTAAKRITTQIQQAATDSPQTHPNSLLIPKMLLDTALIEGPKSDSFNLLNQGAWRLPFSSSPDKGGNTVIAGHRFSYTGPRGIFYYMDKLAVGDDVAVWWDNTLYTYKVDSVTVARATDVHIQDPTDDARLTLYTCTPLWNPVKRLVVVARPIASHAMPPQSDNSLIRVNGGSTITSGEDRP